MPKNPDPRHRKPRTVRIASGAQVPRIDLAALFRQGPTADSVTAATATGTAMTGGGVQAPDSAPGNRQGNGRLPLSNTVALADGTRITFAAADWVRILESA